MKKITLLFCAFLFQINSNAQYSFTQLNYVPNSNGNEASDYFVYNNKLHFVAGNTNQICAETPLPDREIWTTTGDVASFSQLADINSCAGSYARDFFEFNGNLFFIAGTGENGVNFELYKTDGTTTELFREFAAGNEAGFDVSNKTQFRVMNNKMYFFASEGGVTNYDLWRTDGTIAGTEKVADLNTTSDIGKPDQFIVYNNELYFVTAQDNLGFELYKYNENTNLVSIVKDIYPGTNSSSPRELILFNNELFFHVTDPISFRRELYKTDGTSNGTISYRNFTTGIYGPTTFKVFNNQLIFIGLTLDSGQDLYKCVFNSSTAEYEISLIKDFNKGSLPFNFVYGATEFIELNNYLYFSAREANGPNNGETMQLYKTIGNSSETEVAVSFTNLGFNNLRNFKKFNNKLFFYRPSEITFQEEIWVTNGTNEILQRLSDQGTGTPKRPYNELIEYNNELYFTGNTNLQGDEIWKITDSTLSTANTENPIKISVSPNPTNGIVEINGVDTIRFSVELIDVTGKIRITESNNQSQIDISTFQNGIYFLKIKNNQTNEITVKKIVKK